MAAQLRIQLNFLVTFDGDVPPMGEVETVILDAAVAAVKALYPGIKARSDIACAVEPNAKLSITRVTQGTARHGKKGR
jgi:hypothetical protein